MAPLILIIDKQDQWREMAVGALEEAGFYVWSQSTYDYAAERAHFRRPRPDLVVLGCSRVGEEEMRVIQHLVEQEQSVLVLAAALPPETMRLLFLLGVDDVADKPFVSASLVQEVRAALARASQPAHPQDVCARSPIGL